MYSWLLTRNTQNIRQEKKMEIMLWIIYITIYNLLENSVYEYICKLTCVDIFTIDIKCKILDFIHVLYLCKRYDGKPSQPDGFGHEHCTAIILKNIHNIRNWHDVPCAVNNIRHMLCEKPMYSSRDKGKYSQTCPCGHLY